MDSFPRAAIAFSVGFLVATFVLGAILLVRSGGLLGAFPFTYGAVGTAFTTVLLIRSKCMRGLFREPVQAVRRRPVRCHADLSAGGENGGHGPAS